MCTIHTYSAKYYRKYQREINGQILQDSVINDDGISVVFLDGHNAKKNTVIRTMSPEHAIGSISALMEDATKYARVFVHLRAATTAHVGVGFTHAFDDMRGVFYMHNGVITNTSNLAVDSFNMANWADTRGSGLLVNLLGRKESFANVLRIDTVGYKWSVTRMNSGSLHTDGHGNYSSKSFGTILTPVDHQFTQSYTLNFIPKQTYTNYYHNRGTSTNTPSIWNGSSYVPKNDSYYGVGYRGDWSDGKKWDWEAKQYVSESEWEQRRKARADQWTGLYEEDEVGGSADKTLPPFVNATKEEKEERNAVDSVMKTLATGKAALETARQLLDDGEILDALDTEVDLHSDMGETGGEPLSELEIEMAYQENLEELTRIYGYSDEYLDSDDVISEYSGNNSEESEYGIGSEGIVDPPKAPVVLGPPVTPPSCPLPREAKRKLFDSHGQPIHRNVIEPNLDLPKYQAWLACKSPKGA